MDDTRIESSATCLSCFSHARPLDCQFLAWRHTRTQSNRMGCQCRQEETEGWCRSRITQGSGQARTFAIVGIRGDQHYYKQQQQQHLAFTTLVPPPPGAVTRKTSSLPNDDTMAKKEQQPRPCGKYHQQSQRQAGGAIIKRTNARASHQKPSTSSRRATTDQGLCHLPQGT